MVSILTVEYIVCGRFFLLNRVDILWRKNKNNTLKALSHEMDLVFDDMNGQFKALIGGKFLYFSGALMIL